MGKTKKEHLRMIELFRGCDDEFLANVANYFSVIKYNKREIIFDNFSANEFVYFVLGGKILAIHYRDIEDEEQFEINKSPFISNIYRTGECLNCESVFFDCSENEHFTALPTKEGATVLAIKKENMQKLLNENQELFLRLAKIIVDNFTKNRKKLEHMCILSAKGRIIECFRDLQIGNFTGGMFPIKLNHEHIAGMVGCTRETVTRIIKELKNESVFILNQDGEILGIRDNLSAGYFFD